MHGCTNFFPRFSAGFFLLPAARVLLHMLIFLSALTQDSCEKSHQLTVKFTDDVVTVDPVFSFCVTPPGHQLSP